MQLSTDEARRRLVNARVLRLATVDAAGTPHLVPVTFAARDDTLVIAVDHKPKRHHNLRRLRNIAVNDHVCVLADEYAEDWTRLWWVRADGRARILEDAARETPLDWLVAKYPQYADHRPDGPVIEIRVTHLTGWAYSDLPSGE